RDFCNNPAFTAAQKTLCNSLEACVRASSCHQNTITDCYCGSTDAVGCRMAGAANGACKALIEQGEGTTDPAVILANFQDVSNPPGAAMSLMFCDDQACPNECIPYGR